MTHVEELPTNCNVPEWATNLNTPDVSDQLLLKMFVLLSETSFVILRKKDLDVLPLFIFETSYGGSWIIFYVSYIHSRNMYDVPMERAWADDSSHTKYSKSTKKDCGALVRALVIK